MVHSRGAVLAVVATLGMTASVWSTIAAPPTSAAAVAAVSLGDGATVEGPVRKAPAYVAVSVTAPLAAAECIWYHTVDGTAHGSPRPTSHNGTLDYVSKIGFVKIPAHKTTGRIATTVNFDQTPEPDETYTIVMDKTTLTNATGDCVNTATQDPDVALGRKTSTVTIIDNTSATPVLRVGDTTVVEGNNSKVKTTTSVGLSAALPTPECIWFHTADYTARSGSPSVHDGTHDHLAVANVELMAPGKTNTTIGTVVNWDTVPEGNETYQVIVDKTTVPDPTGTCVGNDPQDPNVTIVRGAGKVKIWNDDSFIGANLAYADFTNGDLTDFDLTGANFTGANFTGASLFAATTTATELTGADLTGANLTAVRSGGIVGSPIVLPTNWALVDGYLIGPSANLTGAQLAGAKLAGLNLTFANVSLANLAGADLSGAVIMSAYFGNADLSAADFTLANMTGSYFPFADLHGALFKATDLTAAGFTNANLTGATLTGATIRFADLDQANLNEVRSGGLVGPPSYLPAHWQFVNGYLVGPHADLRGANLTGANLFVADLSYANLDGAVLHAANLTGAMLFVTNLSNTDLTDADLSFANASYSGLYLAVLTNANLANANLTNASLGGSDLSGAIFTGTALTGVSSGGIKGTPTDLAPEWQLLRGYLVGPGANLFMAQLDEVNLSGADLRGAILVDTNLTNTNLANALLTDAYISGASFSGALLTGVSSGGVGGSPASLPSPWRLVSGYLIGPGANLTGAALTGADLSGATLTSAVLTDSTLTGADVTNADLSGANLNGVRSGGLIGTPAALPSPWLLVNGYLVGPGANLANASLVGEDLTAANLASAVLTDADLTGANLRFARLVGADLTDANLSGANLFRAVLTGASTTGAIVLGAAWFDTICPDASNSNSHGNTCVGYGF